MHLRPDATLTDVPEMAEAANIIHSCVHCGFCTAHCPTYQLLGDELDSPRGRIYLIRALLEGKPSSRKTMQHLDRCLNCRACETACPSGVRYSRLLHIGQQTLRKRSRTHRAWPRFLCQILSQRRYITTLYAAGRALRPLLPRAWRVQIPVPQPAAPAASVMTNAQTGTRSVILCQGCVQQVLSPEINQAARLLLHRLGVRTESPVKEGCCGALQYHYGSTRLALRQARHNIDIWWPHLQTGTDMILSTASGCGLMIKEYGELLGDDPRYAERAAEISARTRDIAEYFDTATLACLQEQLAVRPSSLKLPRLACQCPCTLQHGQDRPEQMPVLLRGLGFELSTIPPDGHCCGSAGIYSLLHPGIARRLGQRKVQQLMSGQPDILVTANIGCLHHLRKYSPVPVQHWLNVVADTMASVPADNHHKPAAEGNTV